MLRVCLIVLLLVLLFVLTGCARRTAPTGATAVERVAAAEEVIYEIFVRDFTPEGTFRAIIPRLDELQELGVTTLWLMPIHPVGAERRKGELGSPYAVADYRATNPRFGTTEDVRALVEAAHARGMKLIIDLVANHTAWDHPWLEEHPEWYTRDSTGALTHPLGTDWTDVADLDYANPELRAAMRDAMRYWVEEIGIDGYRCDVAELVPLDFWEEAIAELRQVKPVLMLAEGADPTLYDAGFDLTYAWDTYQALKAIWEGAPASRLYEVLREEQAAYPETAARLRFTTNHDETAWDDTPVGLFGGLKGARAAAVVAATLPGALLVYNGQEVGSTQRLPLFEQMAIEWDQNPEMRRFYDALLEVRAAHPALRNGTVEPLEAGPDVLAYTVAAGSEPITVLVNVRAEPAEAALPGWEPVALAAYGWRLLRGGDVLLSSEAF